VEAFSGQPADVTGFVYRDVRFDAPGQFMVARFAISCCVADASAIGLIVQWPKASVLARDSWVHVQGRFSVQDINGQRTPILLADAVDLTTQPEHPYLYP
jgi:putative membrane protein